MDGVSAVIQSKSSKGEGKEKKKKNKFWMIDKKCNCKIVPFKNLQFNIFFTVKQPHWQLM